jgi:hypothetical protein
VDNDHELNDDTIDDQPDDTSNIRALRQAAEDGKRAREEAAEARRELLFVKAGVDTESKLGQLLFKTYEGNDLEALKQEWTELSGSSAPTSDPGPTGSEQAVDNVRDQLRNAPPGGAEPAQVDAYALSFETYHSDLAKGLPTDTARENAVSVLFEQFMSGNTSVQFDPADWSRQQQLAGDGQ